MLFTRLSLACFLPKVFILISWLDASFHFVDIYLMLRDMFIHYDLLVFALYTYHEPDTSFFVWSLIQFSTRCSYFHYGKVKGTFSYSHFFRESCLDHLTIFLSYGARVEGWFKDMWLQMEYWSRDSVFFTPLFISDYWWRFSGHICSHLTVDTFMTLEFLSYFQF